MAALITRLDEIDAETGDDGGAVLRRDRRTVLVDAHAGRDPAPWDAADIMWFADAAAATAFLAGEAATHADWRLAAVGQVIGRRIATEVWVVGR